MKTDHVVMRGDGATCLHCGDHQQFTVPQSMDSWLAVARAFDKAHAKCRKPSGTKSEAAETAEMRA